MIKEGFCLACLAAPIALIASSQSKVILDSKTLCKKKILHEQRKQKLFMYGSIVWFVISLSLTVYFMNGGCKECS